MAVTVSVSGTVDNAMLRSLVIVPEGADFVAYVDYAVTVPFDGGVETGRRASWVLSPAEKTAILSLVPGAKAAVAADLGL